MQTWKSSLVISVILATIFISFLAIIIILLIYLYQKKKLNHQQKIATLNLTYEKGLLATQLESQEATFKDISIELHDNIIPNLSVAKLCLTSLDSIDERSVESKINTSIRKISGSIYQLHSLSRSLKAETITLYDLDRALTEEINILKDCGLFTIELNTFGKPVARNVKKELAIFRIVLEFLTNIIKHSEAKNVSLILRYYPDRLDVFIEDDGKGFQYPLLQRNSRSLGLNNIKNRIGVLDGEISISTSIGKGTSIFLSIPN
jgi:signal transduction histidine kinase